MSLTIEIAPEVETRLEAEAKRNGVSKADLAKTVIEKRFAPIEKREDYIPAGVTPRYIGRVEMRDFSSERAWLREHRHEYIGQYVAIYGNRLLVHDERFKEVAAKAREMGFPEALLTYIEPLDTPPFAGV